MAALTQLEVEKRLQSYESTKVTDTLYDMGKMLLDECGQRLDYLDAKSARVAGYIGAIVSLMVSTFPIWTSAIDRWAVLLAAIGSFAGMVGGAVTLRSMWPEKFLLPSDSDWLESDALGDPDRLRRYYISSMHMLITSQAKVSSRKISAIKSSQLCLAIMILSLFVVLGNATYRVARHSSRQPSDHAALMVSSARQ